MPLHPDWKEFIELLNSNGVEYLVVGTHAKALHGVPRYTRDIDILVRASTENAERLANAIVQFGFASTGLSADDFCNGSHYSPALRAVFLKLTPASPGTNTTPPRQRS